MQADEHVIEAYLGTPRERQLVAAKVKAKEKAAVAAEAEVLLELKGVDVFYDKVQVLDGVDMTVRRGERVALLGTNGAGKSTILKPPSGLVTPIAGLVTWKGEDVTAKNAEQLVRKRARARARRPRAVPDAHRRREPPHGRLPARSASRSTASSSAS